MKVSWDKNDSTSYLNEIVIFLFPIFLSVVHCLTFLRNKNYPVSLFVFYLSSIYYNTTDFCLLLPLHNLLLYFPFIFLLLSSALHLSLSPSTMALLLFPPNTFYFPTLIQETLRSFLPFKVFFLVPSTSSPSPPSHHALSSLPLFIGFFVLRLVSLYILSPSFFLSLSLSLSLFTFVLTRIFLALIFSLRLSVSFFFVCFIRLILPFLS